MHQEELSTITAPITDDEVFIIEDSFGSGDVFVGDVMNSTESQPTTKVNSTRMATRAPNLTMKNPKHNWCTKNSHLNRNFDNFTNAAIVF